MGEQSVRISARRPAVLLEASSSFRLLLPRAVAKSRSLHYVLLQLSYHLALCPVQSELLAASLNKP